MGYGDIGNRSELMVKIHSPGSGNASFFNPPTNKSTTSIDIAWGGKKGPGPMPGEPSPYLSFAALDPG